MPEDKILPPPSEGLLGADEYERRAEMDAKANKGASTIRNVVIAACLVAAAGVVAMTSNRANEAQAETAKSQQFAAANPKQVEPQQMKIDPTAPSKAPEEVAPATVPKAVPEKLAKADAPKTAARVSAPKAAPAPAPAPIEAPAAAVTPPPAETIPEVAPPPAAIAPDTTAAPPAAATP
jgi:hypothetical protein